MDTNRTATGQFIKGDTRTFKSGAENPSVKASQKQRRNVAELQAAVRKHMGKAKYDPFIAMIEIAQEAQQIGDLSTALAAAKELANYLLPKLKSVEVTGAIETHAVNHVVSFIDAEEVNDK